MIGDSDRVWISVHTSDSRSFRVYTSHVPRVGEFILYISRTYEVCKVIYDITFNQVVVKAVLCD